MNEPRNQNELLDLLGSLCNDALAFGDRERLEGILAENAEARQVYFDYIDMHLQLRRWRRAEVSELPVAVPPLVSPYSSSLSPQFVDRPVFSYMVASVVLCVMLLSAWAYKVTHDREFVDNRPIQQNIIYDDDFAFVGQITGMKGCRWADPNTQPILGAHVPMGRRYALASGLFEITYRTGAKVILQGPCEYTVDSDAGGYLKQGKLVARVKKNDELGIRNIKLRRQESDIHHSSFINQPLFSVRTPTAVVTDLGTEFGVEVNKNGNTVSHVFEGSINVRAIGDNTTGAAGNTDVILRENESVSVEAVPLGKAIALRRVSINGDEFVRYLPMRLPIPVHATGIGLQEGDSDPHWQIVARSDEPGFAPRPAVVTAPTLSKDGRRYVWYQNNPVQSQWISTGNGPPDLPLDTTYTFKTTFTLTGLAEKTAELRLRFIVDNKIHAIRLNGRELPPHKHPEIKLLDRFETYLCKEGFVEGENVLELDVYNGSPDAKGKQIKNSPMGLRVEFDGHYISRGLPAAKNAEDRRPSAEERRGAAKQKT